MITNREKIQAGDFVQLTSWFNDVWAQVLVVSHYETSTHIEYVSCSKYGTSREIDYECFWRDFKHYHDFRRAIRPSNPADLIILEQSKLTGVVYTDNEYFGGFDRYRKWDNPLVSG